MIPRSLSVLRSSFDKEDDDDDREDAIYLIANLVSERKEYKNEYIKQGLVQQICDIISSTSSWLISSLKFVGLFCWLISLICQKPYPSYEKVRIDPQ
jgi:hypothetical protein